MAKPFAVWKTIKIGARHLRTGHDFIAAITEKGMEVCHFAGLAMLSSQFKIADKEAEVNLVAVSVLDLGFDKIDESRGIKGATIRQVYSRAKELGLQLCPAEIGPQLRLQYQEQSGREWLIVAMDAIIDSLNLPWLFRVEHEIEDGRDIRSLCSFCGRLDSFCPADFRFVFVLPGTS